MKSLPSLCKPVVLLILLDILSFSLYSQTLITGRVTDEKGDGIPGVNILVKGTNSGTTTDNNGNYRLNAVDENGALLFSFIGYVTQEIAINNRSTIDITLALDVNTLQEVAVVGYGTQKKKDVTGAVGTISGKEVASLPVASVDQALQGKMAGVYVSTNSGEPGGGVSIRVRGMGGFGASEPLYVIDGVIITYNDPNTSYNPLATLNMADIESINVLKDASASAIYGARAGNGRSPRRASSEIRSRCCCTIRATACCTSPRRWDISA